jgi:hypothetical protein
LKNIDGGHIFYVGVEAGIRSRQDDFYLDDGNDVFCFSNDFVAMISIRNL